MAQVSHKAGVEEKGKRTVHSPDVYLPKGGLKETALCKKCGALYHDKRWTMEGGKPAEGNVTKVTCPACQRMADNNPAGVATFSGEYLLAHEAEILNSIQNIEAKARQKNPLGRIMEIRQDKNILTVTTTEEKLAQKLGREIFRAHKGELHYQWSHEESFVRVNWSR
ncbi:hypothetical protein GURASL_37390 [Geotalea uraniireducens]|uniref:Nmd3 N-terminal domain-containing protein n=1 Tax=Geotalea uraniireducens TaxID=351604 RepID=A0ABM8EQQ6_9BACT|nr:BCAM0308 family protein [Geotalea uraniireducens]BDV44816.1 hypothetical protein GURASL_37390 [Geotalea uraniireducens]